MKDLSIKAKAYDKALERVKELLSRCRDSRDRRTMVYRVEDIESIFSELKKSENEKIKHEIKVILANTDFSRFALDYTFADMISWLKKQGEQKPVDSYCQENCKGFQETEKCFADGECKAKREAETIDKFKPKFKVGDWVVFDNGNVEHITSVGTHGYTFDDGDYLLHDECDKIAHLWSIQDAKEGDVLTWDDTSCVILFKNIKNSKCFISYCFANDISFEIGTSHYIKGCHPATKEQRDLLFDKMKEDGYEWDAEKKELKKIDSEITIPFGAKDSELREATYYIPKGFYAEIKGDIVLIKKSKQKPEWSEEDEHRLKDTIYFLDEAKKHYASTVELDGCIDWLKSLKQRRIGG